MISYVSVINTKLMIRKRLKLVNITKKGKYIQQFKKKKLYSGFVLPFEKKIA